MFFSYLLSIMSNARHLKPNSFSFSLLVRDDGVQKPHKNHTLRFIKNVDF